jgi:opacity protein-like surface antigen
VSDRTHKSWPVRILPTSVFFWLLASLLIFATSRDARAQGFISPFIGYDFGGDANCPNISGCQDKRLNVGVAAGTMGNFLGFEEEFAYAKDFFGNASGLSSNVLTLMSNLMIVPNIGPIRPYVIGGLGLIKTHVELTPTSVFTSSNNDFGWDVGGGLALLLGGHVGVRGDVRYFHTFQDVKILGLTISDPKLDFGRVSAGLVLKF